MFKNKKIVLFAFATKDLHKSVDRIRKQAKESNYYDEIKILGPSDFDEKMKSKFQLMKKNERKKGYGYWFWKPIFLSKIISGLKPDDIVHYADIGCHIQNKNSRFHDYLDILTKKENFVLPFQYFIDHRKFSKDISFIERQEYEYTKSDLLNYFNFLENKKITHSPQFWAGSFFLKNCERAKNFLNEWINIFHKRFELINDSNSNIKNFDGFKEHRHDQSVFSLLCKKYAVTGLSAYECEWGEKENKRTWDHNLKNPILAKRDLKYNIFKRFINRQKKNWNRIKRKYFS